jgi:2-hydroxy-6-oxonona-2,4-dienedioate hydrolase
MTAELTKEGTSRFLESEKIHYHEAGQGPALILIHGSGPGVTGWANFRGNIGVFAQHYHCFIVDLPGYGGSAPVEGNPMATAAQAIIRFMDDKKIDKAHIIGNSLGGLVGSIVAAQHPARVNRFVAIGGIGYNIFTPFPGEGITLLSEFAENPTRENLVRWLRSMVYDESLITEALIEERMKQALEPNTLASTRALYSKAALNGLKAMNAGPNAAASFAHLASIQAPTLLTWGRDDKVSAMDRALVPMRMVPNCELHVFSNCGHWTMIERKAEFENVVLAFLARG